MSHEVEDYDEAFEWIALNEIKKELTSWKGKKALDHLFKEMEQLSKEKPFLTALELRVLLASALRFGMDS